MTTTFKTRTFAAIATVSIAATLAVGTTPAQAKNGRNAALIGGIAAGLIGAIATRNAYADQGGYDRGGYDRGGYDRGGYLPVSGYGECWNERRPVYDSWGEFRGYRFTRICQ